MIITIAWVAVAIVALVLYLRQVYSTFSKVGVNHLPVVPFFGNFFRPFFKLENGTKTLLELHAAFPDDKVVGQYEMLNPVYMVQDLEIMKNVTVKDFDHFVDRRGFATDDDPLFGRGLLNLRGEEWKAMRSTLSPAFTSSKMRLMVPFMVDVGVEMIKVLKSKIKESGNKYIDVDVKDLTTRYANDVIASCAFGLKVDSQSSDSVFYVHAKNMSSFNLMKVFKIFFGRNFPALANMFGMSMADTTITDYFRSVVLTTMQDREKRNIIRHDMIKLLSDIKKGKLSHEKEADTDAGFATVEESSVGKKQHNREWSDHDLVAQAVLFLIAGFDTVSTAMTFILSELAVNQDIQDKLREEIMKYDVKNGGKFDFNSIQSMKYMDMVVSEGLRKYSPAPLLDRICVKDYNFGRVNKTATKDLIIRNGPATRSVIPESMPAQTSLRSFHHNPKLYPNPEKFDPERFSDENKQNIKPFSYMAFGLGPRNCIGSRFALCEVKVMLYQLLREMRVSPGEKMTVPIQLADGFLMTIKNGAWVRLEEL